MRVHNIIIILYSVRNAYIKLGARPTVKTAIIAVTASGACTLYVCRYDCAFLYRFF